MKLYFEEGFDMNFPLHEWSRYYIKIIKDSREKPRDVCLVIKEGSGEIVYFQFGTGRKI